MVAAVLAGVVPAFASAQIPFLPLDEVRPGMTGEGRTTFSGIRIETFEVEILGVLKGTMPDRSVILARLSGGPLAHTGVMQGMSGSPVRVDGRLVGAVAYAFPFAKDAICGITPFEEMVRFTEPAAGADPAVGARLPQLTFSPEGLPSLRPSVTRVAGFSAGGGQLVPIRTPVAATGLSPAARHLVAPLFRDLGMELSFGGFAPTHPPAGTAQNMEVSLPLRPGSPVGATLIGGDLVFMGSGTVTHVEEATGEVYAFGHPFTGLGSLSIPMQEARIEAPVASLSNSFLLASAGAPIGVWRQDRATGIRGRLGARARTIPMEIEVHGSRGGRRTYSLELVDHELLSPALAFTGLVSILSQEERAASALTLRVAARIGVAGGRTVPVEDIFASGSAGVVPSAAALVAAPVALLLGNPVERVPVRSIQVEVHASEDVGAATLTRAWTRSSQVRPGESTTLRVAVRDFRGEERIRELEVPVPASAAGSRLQVTVADAVTAGMLDQAAGVGESPTRIEQIFRAISRHRRQSRLIVRLSGSGRPAAVVGGEYLPSLPPSVRSVLGRDASLGSNRRLTASVIWEGRLDFDVPVAGRRQFSLQVEAR